MDRHRRRWRRNARHDDPSQRRRDEEDLEALGKLLEVPEHPFPEELIEIIDARVDEELERTQWRPIRVFVAAMTPILFFALGMPATVTGMLLAPSLAVLYGWHVKRELRLEYGPA